MFRSIVHRAGVLFVLGSLASSAGAAATRGLASESQPKFPTSVRFIDAPSSESPAARRARLKKECQGRPNAGACLGHTGRD